MVKGLGNPIAPAVEKVVFQIGKDEISPVVQCPDGFHVVRVEQVIPQNQIKYEDVKSTIALSVKLAKCQRQEVWDRLHRDSSIQYFENFDRGSK